MTRKGAATSAPRTTRSSITACRSSITSPASPRPRPSSRKELFRHLWRLACDTAASDDKLVAITPAMREGSGMVRYSKEFPDRYFDVGIAEQHSVTFAAGPRLRRPQAGGCNLLHLPAARYDQLVHDVVLQNLPVVFAIDRAGLVGADGPTHAGSLTWPSCVACRT